MKRAEQGVPVEDVDSLSDADDLDLFSAYFFVEVAFLFLIRIRNQLCIRTRLVGRAFSPDCR
jgi:hypothetical protein